MTAWHSPARRSRRIHLRARCWKSVWCPAETHWPAQQALKQRRRTIKRQKLFDHESEVKGQQELQEPQGNTRYMYCTYVLGVFNVVLRARTHLANLLIVCLYIMYGCCPRSAKLSPGVAHRLQLPLEPLLPSNEAWGKIWDSFETAFVLSSFAYHTCLPKISSRTSQAAGRLAAKLARHYGWC